MRMAGPSACSGEVGTGSPIRTCANQKLLEHGPIPKERDMLSRRAASGLEEAGKLLLEPGQPPAAVDQVLLATGPGRMRLRIDVEMQGVARLAPGGAGLELGAV